MLKLAHGERPCTSVDLEIAVIGSNNYYSISF